MRNGKVMIVQNIKLNKDYKNVLSYSSSDMLTLCNNNKLDESNNFSFVRQDENTIEVQFKYSDCLKCNYLAFQNPNYSNKWFYAFIDNVKYINDSVVRITFTIDVWATFYDDLTFNDCFVIREHTNDDTIGANTQPENVELGEYITMDVTDFNELNPYGYMILFTKEDSSGNKAPNSTNYGGIWMPGGAYYTKSQKVFDNIIASYQDGRSDYIYLVYTVPDVFVDKANMRDTKYVGQSMPAEITKSIAKATTLNTYTPKNNKLLTSPYSYILLTNNNGSAAQLRYEYFESVDCSFTVYGIPVIGSSSFCTPIDYKADSSLGFLNSLSGGKYPTSAWSKDEYTNWLTQNAVNISLGMISSVAALGVGISSGSPLSIAGGTISIAQSVGKVYEHSLAPETIRGNTNNGDILTACGYNTFYIYRRCINEEYAKVIDDYFSYKGYATNKLKKPNITGRRIWNYVQVSNEDDLVHANIPHEYLETINDFARRGFTVWHKHQNLGNYSLDNNIVN